MDDAELLRRYARDGSEEAFRELVRRYLDLVYSAALRQVGGDIHRADDVTQTVFADLARKARDLARHQALAGWLYTSTHFAAAKMVRSEVRRQTREAEAHTMHELIAHSEPEVDWDRIRPVLDDVMHELDDRQRTAVVLRFFDQRPMTEVGEKLGLSESAARKGIDRTLEDLRALLAKRGIHSTGAALVTILGTQTVLAAPAGMAVTISGSVLAGVTSDAGAAAFLHFMSTTKTISIVATAVVFFAVGTLFYEYREIRQTRSALAVANHEYDTQQKHLLDLENQGASSAQVLDALRLSAQELNTNSPIGPPARDPKADGQAFFAAFPEQRAAIIEIGKGQIGYSYRAFYRAADLSPSKIEQFENIISESYASNFLLTPIGAEADITKIPTDQLHELLGDRAFQQYQDVQRTLGAYGFALQLATAVTNADVPPISTDQATQLTQIVLNNNSSYQSGGPFSSPSVQEPGKADSTDWNSVMAQAQSILSPQQLQVAQGLILMMQFRTARNQALYGQSAPAPAPHPVADQPQGGRR